MGRGRMSSEGISQDKKPIGLFGTDGRIWCHRGDVC